jgi:hypothetical protein
MKTKIIFLFAFQLNLLLAKLQQILKGQVRNDLAP